jgi:hypothetical protein
MTTLSAPVGGAAVPSSTLLSGFDKQTADNHVVAPMEIMQGTDLHSSWQNDLPFPAASASELHNHGTSDPAILTQLMSINCIPARQANRFEA